MLSVRARLIPCLLLLLMATAAPAAEPPVGVSYDLPEQRSLEEMNKTDAQRTLLTDGKHRTDGPGAVWGRWNVKPYIVDWTFERPARVRRVQVAIIHPNETSDRSHPARVMLFGADDDGAFLQTPDATLEIPFQTGKLQVVDLIVPGEGVVAKRLRTVFESARSQTVLTEVSFDAEPVDAAALQAAQEARVAMQPPPLEPVVFLPPAVPVGEEPASPFFGVCGHILHTDLFSPGKFSPWWRLEHTLPWVVSGRFGSVREALYMPLLAGDESHRAPNGRTVGDNRRVIEDYLAEYQRHGVRVLLAPMFSAYKDEPERFASFMTWIGDVTKRYDHIIGVEMHNEPNLRGFWRHSVEAYVEASRLAARHLRATGSTVPIVVGSFAGWGGAAQATSEIAYAGAHGNQKAWAFAETVFRNGALEFADAVSAHPYRNSSPPEGGLEVEAADDLEGFEKELLAWWAMVESHRPADRPLKLLLTEIGYSSSTTGYAAVGSVERQADYLSRLMLILLDVRLRGVPLEAVFWYDLKRDDPSRGDYESNFGLIEHDLSHPRPGFLAYRRIVEAFGDPRAYERLELERGFGNWADAIKSYAWRRKADGALIVPFWRNNVLQATDADFASELSLTLPVGFEVGTVTLHDLHEDRPRRMGHKVAEGRLTAPLWVTARAAWLEITAAE